MDRLGERQKPDRYFVLYVEIIFKVFWQKKFPFSFFLAELSTGDGYDLKKCDSKKISRIRITVGNKNN